MSDTNPLLNNASVQGAAKSIEGILDPNTATIKPQEEATQVEPKEPEAKAEVAECGACGAEIAVDATECGTCGAKFE